MRSEEHSFASTQALAAQLPAFSSSLRGTGLIDWYWPQDACDLVEQAQRSESAGTSDCVKSEADGIGADWVGVVAWSSFIMFT